MKTQVWICKIKLRVAVHPLNIKIHYSAHIRRKMQFRQFRVSRYIVMVTSRVHRYLVMFTLFFFRRIWERQLYCDAATVTKKQTEP